VNGDFMGAALKSTAGTVFTARVDIINDRLSAVQVARVRKLEDLGSVGVVVTARARRAGPAMDAEDIVPGLNVGISRRAARRGAVVRVMASAVTGQRATNQKHTQCGSKLA